MGHLSSVFNGLARSLSITKGKNSGNGNSNGGVKEAVEAMAKDAKKNELMLCSSGTLTDMGSGTSASVFTKRGEKGVNQDSVIVWEGFGCQQDMMFCGIFDGHGQWGHFVAKRVRELMPWALLCNWQQALAEAAAAAAAAAASSLDQTQPDDDVKTHEFDIWKHSYVRACAAVDEELLRQRKIDSFHSGTTALTILRQGEILYIANVGDSRAVLATKRDDDDDDDGSLIPVQLTVDQKPNLPQETERIIECRGRVFGLDDEPGVHRLWLPNEDFPGLAMSRAFGDYCIKDFGLVSVPEVTHRSIRVQDQFIILATDGVWDVVSNEEAVEIVGREEDRSKSARRLVEWATKAWRRKRRGVAIDDISAICLFFHTSSLSHDAITFYSSKQ